MKKLLIILIFILAVHVQGICATLYLRSAGGNWPDPNTWSASSNGAVDGAIPDANTPVIADPNSGSAVLTVNTASNCKGIDFTGFTGTFTISADLHIKADLILNSSMNFTYTAGYVRIYGSTMYSNNKTWPCHSNLINGICNLGDDINTVPYNINIYNPVFNTNDFNLTCNVFQSVLGYTSTVNLSNSTLTCNNFTLGSVTSTFNHDTSTVIVNQSATGAMSFSHGTAQFYNLTLNGHASTGCYKAFAGDLTINNTLTIAGNSSTNKFALKSSDITVRTITATTINLSNIDYYQNIKGAGDGWIGKVPFLNSASSWNPNLKYSGILR